jgi:hypothetical protein
MKAINNHFEKAPLWKVYVIGVLIFGTFTFLLFQFVTPMITNNGEQPFKTIVNLKIGGAMGLIFGLMWLLMVSQSRSNSKFWTYAETVEKMANEAETREQLESIFNNEFQELRKLGFGQPHYAEVKKIYTILKTKVKYVK